MVVQDIMLYVWSVMNQAEIKSVFDYHTTTGNLIRKSLNKITGTEDHTGYKRTKYKGKTVLCHRLIYIWHHGNIPDHYHVDHIDHNRSNNRIENLQALPPVDNHRKRKPRPHKNASVYKTKNGWIVKVLVKLGPYDTEADAINAMNIL